MEMMVVLLIVSIVAAASAPMLNKKLTQGAATNTSPWVRVGNKGDIAYNMDSSKSRVASIGTASAPEEVDKGLYLEDAPLSLGKAGKLIAKMQVYQDGIHITNKKSRLRQRYNTRYGS